jgi:hypothetical protein
MEHLCRPKNQCGLGVEVLDVKNKYLLSKWFSVAWDGYTFAAKVSSVFFVKHL